MWRGLLLIMLIIKDGQSRANRVIDVITSCDKSSISITLEMEQAFKGLVFSKDFSRECHVKETIARCAVTLDEFDDPVVLYKDEGFLGFDTQRLSDEQKSLYFGLEYGSLLSSKSTKVKLHLPSNACGVRTSTLNTSVAEPKDSEDLYYNVQLVVQMDKHLQQSTDQEIIVRCKLQRRAVRINSSALEGVIKTKLREMAGHDGKKTRTGRNRQGWEVSDAEEGQWLLEESRAWMELAPAAGAPEPAAVEVGQPTRLLIQATLPVGVGLRVTNCVAHDGLGEASQKLLDESGCPIDESIFTKPSIHRHKLNGEIDFTESTDHDTDTQLAKTDPEYIFKKTMTYQHAITTFAAFKFPDRAKLHLSCGLELCKGPCPNLDCKVLQKPQHIKDGLVRRARLDKEAKGVVIDRLEVYNSIEVLAPNIELEDDVSFKGPRRIEGEEELLRRFSPGDKTICLSPSKMALAFCILGIIFLLGLAVAFASLVRARRRTQREPMHTSLSFYTGTKSLFSSNESSSSGLSGSKLLLTDSPYLDHHSSSSNNWPYTRAF